MSSALFVPVHFTVHTCQEGRCKIRHKAKIKGCFCDFYQSDFIHFIHHKYLTLGDLPIWKIYLFGIVLSAGKTLIQLIHKIA